MAKIETMESIQRQIALLDMERAKLYKQLRETPAYSVKYIREEIQKIVSKYFAYKMTKDKIYIIVSGDVTHKATPKPRSTTKKIINTYNVVLKAKVYDKEGKSNDTEYRLSVDELPANVQNFLSMGNSIIDLTTAKNFMGAALKEEKILLQAKLKETNARLAEIDKVLK